MKRSAFLLALPVLLASAGAPAQAGLTFYTDPTLFASNATGLTTDTFAGVVSPSTSFNYYGTGSYTSASGTTYAIDRATSNGNLFIVGADYYGTGSAPFPYISSQESTSTDNNLVITPLNSVTAIGFEFATFGSATLTFTLSTGDQFTETSAGGPYPGPFAFIGFTSTAAITSFQISDPVSTSSAGFNLSDLSYGTAVVPEPSSFALCGIAAAVGMIVARVRLKISA